MAASPRRLHILAFPYADSLSAARLRAITPEARRRRQDFVLDYDELRLAEPSSLTNSQ